jgi:Txe/YoeB family toxin of Txe-Axe toxin-antitoxin module
METRDRFMGVNSIFFYTRFPDEDTCYRYIADIKWASGFVCKKCSHGNYCAGRKPSSRRCTRCKYDESPTAGTMFDKCKFSLHLAFHLVFKISTKKKGMSSLELSHEFNMRQKTCWEFKRKIQQAMRSSKQHPLNGTVHVDEFYVGKYEEGKSGRRLDSKKRLVVVGL